MYGSWFILTIRLGLFLVLGLVAAAAGVDSPLFVVVLVIATLGFVGVGRLAKRDGQGPAGGQR